MKKYANLFILGLLVIVFTASCSDQKKSITIDNHETRAGQAEAMQVQFNGKTITLNAVSTTTVLGFHSYRSPSMNPKA